MGCNVEILCLIRGGLIQVKDDILTANAIVLDEWLKILLMEV